MRTLDLVSVSRKTLKKVTCRELCQQKGMTIIELLLASTLALMLLTGLCVLYICIKQNYNLQQTYARIQEGGRFITSLLTQKIHAAGLAICQSQNSPIVSPAIIGYDSEHLPSGFQIEVKPDTDVMTVTSCTNNQSNSESLSLVQMAYFVGDTHRVNSQGEKIYALFQKPFNGNREELVPGISQMKVQYGILDSTGNNVEEYLSDKEVTDWSKVVAVYINFLIDSIEPMTKNAQPYYYQNQWMTPVNHLLYQPWSFYAVLREFQPK